MSAASQNPTPINESSGQQTADEKVRKEYEKPSEVDRIVDELNEKFFVVENFGDQCVVCWLEDGPNPKKGKHLRPEANKIIKFQSFANFAHRFEHQRIVTGASVVRGKSKEETETKANIWIKDPRRRQYERVVFRPGQDVASNEFNLWRGFAYEPVKGECGLYLIHLRDNICRGDLIKYSYLIKWMAWHSRNPNSVGETAIVIPGTEGVGKNVAAEGFTDLWGNHGVVLDDEQSVTGKFNAILEGVCVCVCDEAFFAGSAKQANRLKGLITGGSLTIEHKGVNPYKTPNLLRLFILGNDEHIVRAGIDARRFFVTECGTDHKRDGEYFGAIKKQLEDGGYAALLHHLLHEVDLTGFDVRAVPETAELRRQKAYSLTGVKDLIVELAMSGKIPGGEVRQKDNLTYKIDGGRDTEATGSVEVNLGHLASWANKANAAKWGGINYRQLQDVFGKKGLGLESIQRREGSSDQARVRRYWLLPPLLEFRELIDQRLVPIDEWAEENLMWNPINVF